MSTDRDAERCCAGGMVTFTPAALLEDPWIVQKVVNVMQDNVVWSAYIEPKTIGVLSLSKNNDEYVLSNTFHL
jgi:hypothetical protein